MAFLTKCLLLLLPVCMTCAGCVHRIHVAPLQATPSSTTIPRSLQAVVKPISMEGADHRPGITMLEWPNRDVSQAIVGFLQQRATFTSVSSDPADLTLLIATKLSLSSRQGLYYYRISLRAQMGDAAKPLKSYLIEHTAVGSSIRWVTASDRVPIAAALQLALEDLMGEIEADRLLYISPTQQPLP